MGATMSACASTENEKPVTRVTVDQTVRAEEEPRKHTPSAVPESPKESDNEEVASVKAEPLRLPEAPFVPQGVASFDHADGSPTHVTKDGDKVELEKKLKEKAEKEAAQAAVAEAARKEKVLHEMDDVREIGTPRNQKAKDNKNHELEFVGYRNGTAENPTGNGNGTEPSVAFLNNHGEEMPHVGPVEKSGKKVVKRESEVEHTFETHGYVPPVGVSKAPKEEGEESEGGDDVEDDYDF